MICKQCGAQIADELSFCTNCGAKTTIPEPVECAPEPPVQKKNHSISDIFCRVRNFLLSHRVIAIILAIAIFIGLLGTCTNWFGLNGPGTQIANAVRRTLTAKSFTVEFSATVQTGSGLDRNTQKVSGILQVSLDMKNEEVTLYAKLRQSGETMEFAIYDGFMITVEDGRIYKEDIQDQLDDFFDAYEEALERAKDMIKDGQVDWESVLEMIDEDAYEEASETINFKKLNSSLKELSKKMNNTLWLRKNAGYRLGLKNAMKTHTFEPDICDFLAAILPIFKPAFRDRDVYRELQDGLDELEDTIGGLDATLSIGTRFGKLRRLDLTMENNGARVSGNAVFSKIGRTRIDTEKLDDLLDEAKKY